MDLLKKIHTEFNLGFFMPKNFQCDLCNKFESSITDEKESMKEQMEYHLKNKVLSREVKT